MPLMTPIQFVQNTASATWNVNHNLGTYPIVDVLVTINSVLTKIIPSEIVLVDLNNVQIKFSKPYAGQARLV